MSLEKNLFHVSSSPGDSMKSYERIAVQITNLLRAHPRGLTITDISRSLHLNRNSVAKYLEILVISGHVEKQRVGRAKLFFLSQRIPVSAMLNLSSDMILILDGQSRIWYVNDNLLAHEGRDRADLIGKTLEEARLGVLSDPEIRARISRSFDEQEYQKEVFIPRDDGGLFFTVTLVSTIFEDGSRGITVIAEDITKRKRAEEELKEHLFFFQELLDRVPTPVFYKDIKGHYLGCNRAFEDYTGRPRGEILDRKAADVLPPGLANRFEALDAIALKTGTTQTLESTISYDDGTRRNFIVFKAPFLKGDGSPGGIVGTIIDIKNRRETEEALRKRVGTPGTGIRKVGEPIPK
jgi:PAS domain S-box-containing protein